jgi:hypothetical protein
MKSKAEIEAENARIKELLAIIISPYDGFGNFGGGSGYEYDKKAVIEAKKILGQMIFE